MENKDFKDIISMFKNTYTEEVCNYVKSIVKDINIGRIRWMLLKPKSTLSYHRDPYDLLRFHIPVMTNDNAFFIVDDLVYRMEERGNLYAINTNKKHTAVNTDKKERLHIVFDTWSN